jgi:hypothetical protein
MARLTVRLKSWFDRILPVGSRSLLWGAHAFWAHPLFVAIAWYRLYGFPRDIRLWVAFFVHDWGYWGKATIDGPDGEDHVLLGARIMHWLFDRPRVLVFHSFKDGRASTWCHANETWLDFTQYHSRFWARKDGRHYSRLCPADKLATALQAWWLYIPMTVASGEIFEYMAKQGGTAGSKYNGEPRVTNPEDLAGLSPMRAWHLRMTRYCRAWAYAHKDGAEDTWTPKHQSTPQVDVIDREVA